MIDHKQLLIGSLVEINYCFTQALVWWLKFHENFIEVCQLP